MFQNIKVHRFKRNDFVKNSDDAQVNIAEEDTTSTVNIAEEEETTTGDIANVMETETS